MATNKLIPSNISEQSKKFMQDLLKVLKDRSIHTVLDASAIALIAHTYDNYITATDILATDGMIITQMTNAGENLKAHPAVKIQLDSQVQLTRLLIEFGLTPKSRKDISSVKEIKDDTKSALEEFMSKKREVR